MMRGNGRAEDSVGLNEQDFRGWVEAAKLFMMLVSASEERGVSWELSRVDGWSVDGEHAMDEEGRPLTLQEIPREHWNKLGPGYTVTVEGQGYVDEEDEGMIFEEASEALMAALEIMGTVDVKGDEESDGTKDDG